jgi:DNA-directed RNA polymerase specialized sigma24 family protein
MPDHPDPDGADHRRVLERMVAEQPDRLPRRMRRAADDHATAEVAEELGISAGLVRWRLHAARERLRSNLDAALDQDREDVR